jgi:glycosyltransferase involved in cell wall biosynthesis
MAPGHGDEPIYARVMAPNGPVGRGTLRHVSRGISFGLAAANRLRDLIRSGRVDLVNFHNQFAAAMGMSVVKAYGIPTIFTMHNPIWSDPHACRSPIERVRFWLEARAERNADYVIGLSHSVTENRKLFFGLLDAKVAVFPVAVDNFWFEARSPGAEIATKYALEDTPVVLHVGRIAWYKNQKAIVEAFARVVAVEKARLVFAGPTIPSEYFDELRALVFRLGLENAVLFVGSVSLEEMIQLYDLASVVVFPSFRENCPQAVLEAMARGRAVIGSNIPPMREILSNESGVILPAADHEGIASAILRLLRDPEERARLGKVARERAYDVYRWTVVGRKIEKFYEHITRESRVLTH